MSHEGVDHTLVWRTFQPVNRWHLLSDCRYHTTVHSDCLTVSFGAKYGMITWIEPKLLSKVLRSLFCHIPGNASPESGAGTPQMNVCKDPHFYILYNVCVCVCVFSVGRVKTWFLYCWTLVSPCWLMEPLSCPMSVTMTVGHTLAPSDTPISPSLHTWKSTVSLTHFGPNTLSFISNRIFTNTPSCPICSCVFPPQIKQWSWQAPRMCALSGEQALCWTVSSTRTLGCTINKSSGE